MKVIFCLPIIVTVVMLSSPGEVSGQHDRKDSVTITSIIQDKQARNPIEQKIDSRLLQVLNQVHPKKQSDTDDLSQVKTDTAANLEVDISAEVTDQLLAKIKKLGGKIIFPSKQYRTIRAIIPLSSVKTIAGYREVRFINQAAAAQTNSPHGNMNPANGVSTEKLNQNLPPAQGKKQNPL